jgi:hypothetical protein
MSSFQVCQLSLYPFRNPVPLKVSDMVFRFFWRLFCAYAELTQNEFLHAYTKTTWKSAAFTKSTQNVLSLHENTSKFVNKFIDWLMHKTAKKYHLVHSLKLSRNEMLKLCFFKCE